MAFRSSAIPTSRERPGPSSSPAGMRGSWRELSRSYCRASRQSVDDETVRVLALLNQAADFVRDSRNGTALLDSLLAPWLLGP